MHRLRSRLLLLASGSRFDLSTEQGRASERHRRALLSGLASGFARAMSIVTALVSVPLTLRYLGPERYGMWMTISSFSVMLSFADLGIGNGVLSAIARANGLHDQVAMRRYIATAYIALSILALALLAIFAALYPLVHWERLFNVSDALAVRESGPAFAGFAIAFALSIPMTVIQRIQAGLQEGFMSSLWQCGGNVFALVGVVIAILLHAGLFWLVLAFTGIPLVMGLVNTIDFFTRRRPDLLPRLNTLDRDALRELAGSGLLFFLLQASAAIAYGSNTLVIAQVLGGRHVTEYAVPERLFSAATIILSMMMTPLWPAYGEAVARGDHGWMRQTMWRSLAMAFGFSTLFSLFMLIAGPWVIQRWVGSAVAVPFGLLLALAIWKVIEAGGYATSMFLNGVGALRVQVVSGLLTATVSIALKIWWTRALGISGVAWGSIAAYLVFGIPLIVLAVSRALTIRPITRQ